VGPGDLELLMAGRVGGDRMRYVRDFPLGGDPFARYEISRG
jgi:hypothetical protein